MMRITILSAFILMLPFSLSPLEILLNGNHLSRIHSERLNAHARPDPNQRNKDLIDLSSLYPWMDTLEQIEILYGENMAYLNFPDVSKALWDNAFLRGSEDGWDLHYGARVYPRLERISVYGEKADIQELRLWFAVNDQALSDDLDSVMTLRGVTVKRKDISDPAYLLNDPPDGRLPHLIILDDLDLIKVMDDLSSYKTIRSSSPRWQSLSGEYTLPLALDAYSPESPLYWMLAENPKLFNTDNTLPESLAWFLRSAHNKDIIHSTSPIQTLEQSLASSAVQSAQSANHESASSFSVFPAPRGTVNLQRMHYAAIPKGLSSADMRIAKLALADGRALNQQKHSGIFLPIDPRTLRFFKAYDRIGRLVISGEMDVSIGVKLITDYVHGKAMDTY